MKSTTAILSAVLWGAGMIGNLHADDSATRLNDLILTSTLKRFLTIVERDGVIAPVVPSQWVADHAAADAERDRLLLARTFGSNLLERLDEVASQVLDVSDLTQSAQYADVLLRTASWLGRTEGYGNAVLAARAHDVAAVPAGRLLVAANYPTEEVTSLIRRFDGPWYAADVRARILDAEAGTSLFTAFSASPPTQHVLEEVWTLGLWRRASQRGDIAPDLILGGMEQGRVDLW